MSEESRSPSIQLIRDAAILQIKLLADGARDAALIPISIVAALVGLARGGDDPGREFRRVLKLGRRSERWINLFGHQKPLGRSHPAGSIDSLLDRVEDVVLEQYAKAQSTAEARAAISRALDDVKDSPEAGNEHTPDSGDRNSPRTQAPGLSDGPRDDPKDYR